MRTLDSHEVAQVAGGVIKVAVDVNIPEQYVEVNVIAGTKVTTLVRVDWSKWFKRAPTQLA